MIVNPGTSLVDLVSVDSNKGNPLVTYDDFPNAATTVASLNNNPDAVTETP